MSRDAVIEEVQALRSEVSQLKALLPQKFTESRITKIRVHIERNNTERKPFTFAFKTPSEKRVNLSATRAAITMILLFDLTERSQGRPGVASVRSSASDVLKIITPELNDTHAVNEQIRVALYRFSSFWRTEFQDSFLLKYDPVEERLSPFENGLAVEVEILTSDARVQDSLLRIGGSMMLGKLRRERFLFVPAGGHGGESFLKEIYSTAGMLRVVTASARPTLITIPPHLVERHVKVPEARERSAMMHDRLRNRSLVFQDILHEDMIRDLLRPNREGKYTYFSGLSREEAYQHVEFIRDLLFQNSGYQLAITRAELPFYVASYSGAGTSITAFFRNGIAERAHEFSAFAVWGSEVEASVRESIFNWLLIHPSTTVDNARVIETLTRILRESAEYRSGD